MGWWTANHPKVSGPRWSCGPVKSPCSGVCSIRSSMLDETQIQQAARAVASADALLIAAGAGMGVDSGLPDFRGDQGFWKAYPPYQTLGLRFTALANPHWFATDPT